MNRIVHKMNRPAEKSSQNLDWPILPRRYLIIDGGGAILQKSVFLILLYLGWNRVEMRPKIYKRDSQERKSRRVIFFFQSCSKLHFFSCSLVVGQNAQKK